MRRLSNGLIDLGGGATPRDPHDKSIVLSTKVPARIMDPGKFKELIKKLDDLGKLDLHDFNTVSEMCQFLDFYNQTVVDKKQSDYDKEITARNEYYYKLWIRAIEES
jgi:hypothetical protein